ncbi:MAG: hypothetical protein D6729_12230 [Deltaproteobacteria bacterium]|nr:MAG: hypothetical protein D6729_12230 [Deltaproteobacteria bacterium]
MNVFPSPTRCLTGLVLCAILMPLELPAQPASAREDGFTEYEGTAEVMPPPAATRATDVLTGRFGIGAHHLLAGESGVSLRYFAGDGLAGEVILRPSLQNLGRDAAFTLLAAARLESVFFPSTDGFIGAFGGGGIVLVGDVVMLLEAGLKGEYLLWQDMSLFAEVGLSAQVDFGDSTNLDFSGGAGPFGAAGFTLWFP